MLSVRGMVSFNWSRSLAGFFSAVLLLFSPARLNNELERCWQCCLVTIHQRESVLHAAPSVAEQLGDFSALCHWCEQIMDHLNYCHTTPLQRGLDSSAWLSVVEVRQFGAICFAWLHKYIVKILTACFVEMFVWQVWHFGILLYSSGRLNPSLNIFPWNRYAICWSLPAGKVKYVRGTGTFFLLHLTQS